MIAICGTGRMGSAIGPRLSNLGHTIIYGSREPNRDEINALVQRTGANASATSVADACEKADWLIFAMPYHALSSTLDEIGDLNGKIIIDVTNALKMSRDGLMEFASDVSSGEEIQTAKPHAKVVKSLNTIGYHIIANPEIAGGPVSSALAGNDNDAKQKVAALVQNLGFETVDLGPIRQARYLEGMAALYLTPYLQGRREDAFEYYFRTGSSPKESKGVRFAG